MEQKAVVKSKKPIYVVWIIPIVAMAVAGLMIYKYFDDKGFEIVITFDSGEGLTADKTALVYNGIKIGQVTGVQVNKNDVTKVDATLMLEKKAAIISKRGTIFWKVEPKVTLTEISGLSTILSGVYIGVMPPSKDKLELAGMPNQFDFQAESTAPVDAFDPGLRFKLKADESDLKIGAPIMFRDIVVGDVENVILTKEGVEYSMHIQEDYAHLIKENSKFWKISGVDIRASLAGIRISMDSLASVIAGGIALSSPEQSKAISSEDTEFILYEDEEATHLASDTIYLTSKLGYNIDEKSTYIYYKGIHAGIVDKVSYDPKRDETTFAIKLDEDFRHLANKDAYFWIVEPKIGLTKVKGLDALARGPYITFETKSKSTDLISEFKLNTQAPVMEGTELRLHAKKSHSLKEGVNIVYNDLVVGTLLRSRIMKTGEVDFDVVIADEYKHLVNETSSFYLQGAVEGEVSLKGMYFNVGSLSSMLHSGIALVTEDLSVQSSKYSFELLDSYHAYKEQEYTNDGGVFYTILTKELGSVSQGSPLLYKGLNVGKVMSYDLDQKSGLIKIKVYVTGQYKDTINASTKFFNMSGIEVKADMTGLKLVTGSVESIISGGISYATPIKSNTEPIPDEFELYESSDEAQKFYVAASLSTQHESGLKVGSKLIYKTMTIGQVTHVSLVRDVLKYDVMIEEKYKDVMAEDSRFWIEDFEFNIDQVKNPAAIVTGAFIKVSKGLSQHSLNHFDLLDTAPAETINQEGLRVVVKGERLSSLKVGSPVFYRQIKIGSIEAFKLSSDSTGVEMRLFIDPNFSYLVRRNSIFYNATAMGMDVSLFGVKLSTETLSTIIHGGITMVVPDKPQSLAREMERFTLHSEAEEEWLEYKPVLVRE
ncbi:PqiB family protein [Lentisphaera araneosa HTCC2155]|uniref:PqiB family protein n=1 Tax=Lentisphaera araneosa HTCC2155 TaxID=313628 RepID=A6DM96_9BACT|nr:MlaD family protein [Lentisphaera araneosa]EDM27086.1 PqiB family protein [Lentisphaera araneosa HTCC2155]